MWDYVSSLYTYANYGSKHWSCSHQNIPDSKFDFDGHAALKSAEIIEQITNTNQSICILCGPGNNGADGLAIARLLQPKYPNLYVVVPEIKKMSEDEKIQFQMVQNLKIPFCKNLPNVTYDIYIDCLFGNGLSRDITWIL